MAIDLAASIDYMLSRTRSFSMPHEPRDPQISPGDGRKRPSESGPARGDEELRTAEPHEIEDDEDDDHGEQGAEAIGWLTGTTDSPRSSEPPPAKREAPERRTRRQQPPPADAGHPDTSPSGAPAAPRDRLAPSTVAKSGGSIAARASAPATMKRIEQLLDRGREAVEAMSSVELNYLVGEAGIGDALELIELASPEQVRELVDMQVWTGDRIDGALLLDWTYALATTDERVRGRLLRGLDVELLALLLRTRCTIYLADEEEQPPEARGVFYKTPDGWFVLDLAAEDEARIAQLIDVIGALYAEDPAWARSLLQQSTWELPGELEEWSLRWRNARLADLGFADPMEALAIYAYIDPEQVRPDEKTADAPLRSDPEPIASTALESIDRSSFWGRALATIDDPVERERLARALMWLGNRALSADRVLPSDPERVRQSLAHLQGRLSLGLEHLCDGRIERAADVLANVALMRIARLGYSLIVDATRPVRRALRTGALGTSPQRLDLLAEPLAAELRPLLAPRPQRLDTDRNALRPLDSLADLQHAARLAEQARLSAALVPLASRPRPLPDDVTLASLFCTELLDEWLGRSGPFDAPALAALRNRIAAFQLAGPAARSGAGRLSDEVVALLASRIAARVPPADRQAARALADGWLDEVADTLLTLRDPIDARFVDCLWVDTPTTRER